jgi:hypothetical protein
MPAGYSLSQTPRRRQIAQVRADQVALDGKAGHAGHCIVARRPHHFWHVDLTIAPAHIGYGYPGFRSSGFGAGAGLPKLFEFLEFDGGALDIVEVKALERHSGVLRRDEVEDG